MSNFFSPNLSLLSDWKSTVAGAFRYLRKVQFVVPDTFTFEDFDPQINYNGMTATSKVLYKAKYLKIGKHLSFSIQFSAILGGAMNNVITFTLPYGLNGVYDVLRRQGGSCIIGDAAAGYEAGLWSMYLGQNTVDIERSPGTPNFTAGAVEIIINGFVEVS